MHLVGGKEPVDDFDVGAQEGHIVDALLQGAGGSRPHAGALDVDSDVVAVGVGLGQLHGVFALAAAQLKDDGVLVVEIVVAPTATHGTALLLLPSEGGENGVRKLKDVPVGLHVGEFRQFAFSHIS